MILKSIFLVYVRGDSSIEVARSACSVVCNCCMATQAEQRTDSHCVFAKMRRRIGDFHAVASNILYLDSHNLESDVCLMFGDLRRTGCGGGRPSIAYSQKLALELANASRRAKISLVKYYHRTV